jgi:hypothetical protein
MFHFWAKCIQQYGKPPSVRSTVALYAVKLSTLSHSLYTEQACWCTRAVHTPNPLHVKLVMVDVSSDLSVLHCDRRALVTKKKVLHEGIPRLSRESNGSLWLVDDCSQPNPRVVDGLVSSNHSPERQHLALLHSFQ